MKTHLNDWNRGSTAWSSMTSVMALGLAVALVSSIQATVTVAPEKSQYRQELGKVSRAEIASKAASMVLAAQGRDRESVVDLIVTAAVEINPTATTAIVGQIVKTSPDVAGLVAVRAAAKQPKQLGAIARAASAAAPVQSVAIVDALCKQSPTQYREITLGAAEGAPGNDRALLNAMVESAPQLKVFLVRATESLSLDGQINQTVSMVVDQMNADLKKVAPALKTTVPTLVAQGVPAAQYSVMPPPPAPPKKTGPNPRLRPPFTPRPNGNDMIPPMTRDDTVVVNPGGPRNYSSP